MTNMFTQQKPLPTTSLSTSTLDPSSFAGRLAALNGPPGDVVDRRPVRATPGTIDPYALALPPADQRQFRVKAVVRSFLDEVTGKLSSQLSKDAGVNDISTAISNFKFQRGAKEFSKIVAEQEMAQPRPEVVKGDTELIKGAQEELQGRAARQAKLREAVRLYMQGRGQ